ncbi:MAG TPA: phosphoglucosamine mutase [Mycobacteriales bacterium]|nr:phosphoglucosamine mutase [Mycobacteriales bacterium]
MARLFGTDGIRGLANGDVLTPDLALRLAGTAGARLVAQRRAAGTQPYERPVVVIGRDTRPSGQMLEAAAVAGFTSAGCDVELLGVVPTPVVAHATAHGEPSLGLMITASHNPEQDNGLKLFADGGLKLADEVEDELEAALAGAWAPAPAPPGIGRAHPDAAPRLVEPYLSSLLASVGSLAGLRVVVDCANGAARELAPELYRRAGATVVAIHTDDQGINRDCGATHPESLAAAVVEHGGDVGIAHDGDADRCIVVDASGTVLNGDQVLGLLALARKEAGLAAGDVLVATVMSNLGLHQAMAAAGIRVVTTAVGDRYVLEEMRAHGYRLGGEQSGHVVLADYATTGDGLLTALQVMDRVVRTGRPVTDLASAVTLLPQVLVNVTADRQRAAAPDVLEAVAREEAALAGSGRVLLRPSGTEPLVRVMVEAPTQHEAQALADRLAAVVAG